MTVQQSDEHADRRRKPRRVRLDAEKIVAAGIEVAAESRSAVFSPKLLGEKLGVDPSAVYRHFPNKSRLMAALLDELHLRVLQRVTAPRERWRERVTQLAENALVIYCEHPSIAAESVVLTTHGPGELNVVELLLDSFEACGLDDDGVVKYYALVAAHILATASGIALSRTVEAEEAELVPAESGTPWIDGPILVDPAQYPRIAHFNARLTLLEDREMFLNGLDALLDAAEREAQQR